MSKALVSEELDSDADLPPSLSSPPALLLNSILQTHVHLEPYFEIESLQIELARLRLAMLDWGGL